MDIKLFINSADEKVVNKTLEYIADLQDCTIKGDAGVENPTLEIAFIPQTVDHASILKCNYVYIPAFNRYYFAKVTVSQQRVFIECDCDVLMSFVRYCGNSPAIVRRSQQSNKYNLYLNDPYFMTLAKNVVEVIHFPNDDVFNGYSYVLTVAGPRGGVV